MGFLKGQTRPVGSGRKKGTPNRKRVPKVQDFLTERDINPAEEIIKLIPNLETKDQVAAWFELLSYIDSKPKAIGQQSGESTYFGEDLTIEDILAITNEIPTPRLLELAQQEKEVKSAVK